MCLLGEKICDFCIEAVEIHAVGFLKQILNTQYCLAVESYTVMTAYTFKAHTFYISKEEEKTGKFYLPNVVDHVCCQMIYFAFMEVMYLN